MSDPSSARRPGTGREGTARARTPSGRTTDAQLEALDALAVCGRFTHAARRLGCTQSAVSHALAALERALGAALVERAADGARLTPLGARVVDDARAVLRLKARMRAEADAVRRLAGAVLRVGSFGVSASRRLLPPLLEAFAARHPGVAVEVREGADDEVEAWLAGGAVDVAFVNLPCEAFDTVAVAEDELHAVVPAGHALARHARLAPGLLGGHPFVMTTGGCEPLIRAALAVGAQGAEGEGGAGEAAPALDVRYRLREVASIVATVGRGLGVAVVPRLALPDAPPPDVAFVPLAGARRRRVALAVRRAEAAGSPARLLLRLAQRRARP